MIAEPLPIRIVRDPISSGETGADCFFQRIKGLFVLTKDGQSATRIVQNRVVVRRQRHRSRNPWPGTFSFSDLGQNAAEQNTSARIIWIEIEVPGGAFQCSFLRAPRLVASVQFR
jgi:hypothetical protein